MELYVVQFMSNYYLKKRAIDIVITQHIRLVKLNIYIANR